MKDPNVATNLAAACKWCNTQESKLSLTKIVEKLDTETVRRQLEGEAADWEKTHPEHAMLLSRRIEGLSSFARMRLPTFQKSADRNLRKLRKDRS